MIIGLDGLRALAFLSVFAIHTGNLSFGWVGVNLFFVLSGFLITDILLRMKDLLPGRKFFSKFYGRRALRIIPLYFFYLLVLTLISLIIPNLNISPIFKELQSGISSKYLVWPFLCLRFFHGKRKLSNDLGVWSFVVAFRRRAVLFDLASAYLSHTWKTFQKTLSCCNCSGSGLSPHYDPHLSSSSFSLSAGQPSNGNLCASSLM